MDLPDNAQPFLQLALSQRQKQLGFVNIYGNLAHERLLNSHALRTASSVRGALRTDVSHHTLMWGHLYSCKIAQEQHLRSKEADSRRMPLGVGSQVQAPQARPNAVAQLQKLDCDLGKWFMHRCRPT